MYLDVLVQVHVMPCEWVGGWVGGWVEFVVFVFVVIWDEFSDKLQIQLHAYIAQLINEIYKSVIVSGNLFHFVWMFRVACPPPRVRDLQWP